MPKRSPGTGSVTPLGPDRFWARLWVDGKRKSFGIHPTEQAANEALDAAMHVRGTREGSAGSKLTFASFAKDVLDIRESEDVRAIYSERRRFARHLADSDLSAIPIEDITPTHVLNLARSISRKQAADGRESRRLSRHTVQRCMALVRAVMSEAVAQGKRADNPCLGVRLRSRATDEDTEEKWDWLRGPEQQAVITCEAIPEWARVMMRFAWGTGLRQGEQWNLELRDLHVTGSDPHVFVRFGSKGKPPKNGRMRKVPLFGEGLAAAKRWLEILPTFAPSNPHRLVFPGPTGARRPSGAPSSSKRVRDDDDKVKVAKVELLPIWLEAAGVKRAIRWHDLRHTCGSSLASGVWGPVWNLHMIKDVLGHSSIKVTERYSHLSEQALREAGNSMSAWGYAGVTGNGVGGSGVAAITNDSDPVGWVGHDPTTYGLKEQDEPESSRQVKPSHNPVITPDAAKQFLQAYLEGDVQRALALGVTMAAGAVTPDGAKRRTG